MDLEFQAIYEHGVFRPLTPLSLPEAVEITLTVRDSNGAAPGASVPTAAELATQQEALNAMFAEADGFPQSPRNDGLSNRDHDQILYGSSK